MVSFTYRTPRLRFGLGLMYWQDTYTPELTGIQGYQRNLIILCFHFYWGKIESKPNSTTSVEAKAEAEHRSDN